MTQTGNELSAFAPDVWLGVAPVSFLGLRLAATTTIVRLADGGLLVHSPGPLTATLRQQTDALGPVRHLYAPSLFHHRGLDEWAAAYPSARVHAPAGLRRKHPGLRIDRAPGDTTDAAPFDGIAEIPIEGFRPRETALLHRASRTLIVADLVQNVGRPDHGWTALYARAMGFYDRVALSRAIRWTGFDDRRAARRALDRILALEFDRLVVGHGAPLSSGGHAALAAAYAWLRPGS